MANHRSAAKRARQSLVRRARNRSTMSILRNAVRAVEAAASENDKAAAQTALVHVTSIIDRAAGKGVMHRSTASRKVSRLTALVNKLA